MGTAADSKWRPLEQAQGRSDLAAPLEIVAFWCSFIIATPQIGPAVEIPQVYFIPFRRKQTVRNKEQVVIFKDNLRHKYELIHRLK